VRVFVRCVYKGELQKNLLLCKLIEAQKTAEDDTIWILIGFFIGHQTDWNKCRPIDVFTNGAKPTIGKNLNALIRTKIIPKKCTVGSE
jgi:hypothetical protein